MALMPREDEVGAGGHPEPRAVDSATLQHVDFVEKGREVDDNSISDDRGDRVVENTARHQLQRVALLTDNDGVTSVVAALVSDDHRVFLGQQVDDLGFALVTPLGADDDGDGHGHAPRSVWSRERPERAPILLCGTMEDVPQEFVTGEGQNRLRMELHSLKGQLTMAHSHDRPIRRGRRYFKDVRNARRVNNQRVVAGDGQRAGQAGEYTASVVSDLGGLSVHQLPRSDNRSTEDMADRLMAKAHTKYRHAALAEGGDRLANDPEFSGRPGPGRSARHQARGRSLVAPRPRRYGP